MSHHDHVAHAIEQLDNGRWYWCVTRLACPGFAVDRYGHTRWRWQAQRHVDATLRDLARDKRKHDIRLNLGRQVLYAESRFDDALPEIGEQA